MFCLPLLYELGSLDISHCFKVGEVEHSKNQSELRGLSQAETTAQGRSAHKMMDISMVVVLLFHIELYSENEAADNVIRRAIDSPCILRYSAMAGIRLWVQLSPISISISFLFLGERILSSIVGF